MSLPEAKWSVPRSRNSKGTLGIRHNQEDVPSFLYNSPFLPVADSEYDIRHKKHQQPRPTLLQILKAKSTRTVLKFVTIALFFLLFWRRLPDNLYARLFGPRCYFSETLTIPPYDVSEVNWAQYAYAQYATDRDYLCNSVMLFETLHKLESKAQRVLMFRESWVKDIDAEVERSLLIKAKEEFSVKLKPVEVQHQIWADYNGPNWSDSFTKLLAFNLTQYERILFLDSDSTLLSPMDELFLLPKDHLVSLPRAYWLGKPTLASHLMLLSPSASAFKSVQSKVKKGSIGFYDMEIVNSVFGSSCSIIPHKRYALLTGEFRSQDHGAYLGDGNGYGNEVNEESWDPERVIEEAKFVHFSDYPLQKPWLATAKEMEWLKPACVAKKDGGKEDCRARDIWLDLYTDFKSRRKSVCGL